MHTHVLAVAKTPRRDLPARTLRFPPDEPAGWLRSYPVRFARNGMTYFDAAIAVLKTSRKAMTAREITTAAVNRGFIDPGGKTPAASMRAALYVHARGVQPGIRRLYRPGPARAARDSVKWVYVG